MCSFVLFLPVLILNHPSKLNYLSLLHIFPLKKTINKPRVIIPTSNSVELLLVAFQSLFSARLIITLVRDSPRGNHVPLSFPSIFDHPMRSVLLGRRLGESSLCSTRVGSAILERNGRTRGKYPGEIGDYLWKRHPKSAVSLLCQMLTGPRYFRKLPHGEWRDDRLGQLESWRDVPSIEYGTVEIDPALRHNLKEFYPTFQPIEFGGGGNQQINSKPPVGSPPLPVDLLRF